MSHQPANPTRDVLKPACGVRGFVLLKCDEQDGRFRSDIEAQTYVLTCLQACDGLPANTVAAMEAGQLADLFYGWLVDGTDDEPSDRPSAARIAACLRACEGIPTAALASCGISGGVKSLTDAVLDLPEDLLHSSCRLVLDAVHDLTLMPTTPAPAEQTTLPLATKLAT